MGCAPVFLVEPALMQLAASCWKKPMSIKLSLKEALGRQGKTPDARQDLSDFRVDRFVLFGKEISRPVDLARFLVSCGLSLRKAHDVLERLSSGAWVPVELRGADPKKIELELSELGVAAHALLSPKVDVKHLREGQNLSQHEFATLYGLEVDTLQNWEQGRNAPDGATMVLLKVIEAWPLAVLAALTGHPMPSRPVKIKYTMAPLFDAPIRVNKISLLPNL